MAKTEELKTWIRALLEETEDEGTLRRVYRILTLAYREKA